jgi:hypothetical protein
LPKQAALINSHPDLVIKPPPFPIVPIELKMAWSPLLHHNPGHTWLRRLIVEVAQEIAHSGKK